MFIINSVALALFGVLFMIMPEFVLTQFKSEVYVATLYVARFFGGALLMGGLLLWFLLDMPAKKQRLIAILLLAYSIGGFVMGLLGMTTIGVLRAYGWVLLVIFGVFAMTYAYMLFLQPKSTEVKRPAPRKPKPVVAPNNGQPPQ
jgi:hypothetical protein